MAQQPFQYELIESPDDLRRYLAATNYDKEVICDTESTGLKLEATLLGFSFYQKGFLLPAFVVRQTPFHQGRGISLTDLQEILNPWFKLIKSIWQNAKYDGLVLQMNGFHIPIVVADTMVEIHLVNPDIPKKLETRVKVDFGYEKKTFEEVIGRKWEKIVWDTHTHTLFTLEQLGEYAAEDAFWTNSIHDYYWPKVQQMGVQKIHDKIELRMIPVLQRMKRHGIRINRKVLTDLEIKCAAGLRELEQQIYQQTGTPFNINSPKQLGEVLYDRLKYRCPILTATGARSTNKEALAILDAQGYPVAKLLSKYSQLDTLMTGFITKIPVMMDADGYLRGDFNSLGTTTGRLSANSPNLQNQPNNPEYPVRAAYTASPGCHLWALDYSQIELRVTAHLSRDPRLIKAFMDGRDIHKEVADALGIDRKAAKIVNFGILYGLGSRSLAFKLGTDEYTAKLYLNEYYQTYVGVKHWKEYVENKAKQQGYVVNMFGRIRPLSSLRSSSPGEFNHGLRQAVNTMVQGTSADLIKLAMIKIDAMLIEERLPAWMMLQVHDELVGEATKKVCPRVFNKIKHIMETICPMRVPIEADGKICDSWEQMKNDDFIGYQDGGHSNDIDWSLLSQLLN